MKQTKSKSTKNILSKKSTALKGAVIGTTGATVLGAAAVGFAGYMLWKNRESIRSFVGKYIDLPEELETQDTADIEGDEAHSETRYTNDHSAHA